MLSMRDHALLVDIADAAKAIQEFVAGSDMEAFLADRRTQSAVQHQIMIMGEAVKHLSSTFLQEHRDVPWALIARMRDRLIHGYGDVDLDVVWDTATESVPCFSYRIARLLSSEES